MSVDKAGQSKANKFKSDRERYRRERELNDLVDVLSRPEGRRVIYRIISEGGVFRSVYRNNPHDMVYAEGYRNLGLWLLNAVEEASPEALLKMQREDRSERVSEQAEYDKLLKEEKDEQQDA